MFFAAMIFIIQIRGTIVFSVELLWTFIKEKDASIYSTREEDGLIPPELKIYLEIT